MSDEKTVQASNDDPRGAAVASTPDPEVVPKAEPQRFTAEYKLRILAAASCCRKPGEIDALLRREGLHRSHLDKWRTQQREGSLRALAPQKRGRKPDPQAAEIARLRGENERLQKRLQQAETIIEVQKKHSVLLCEKYAAQHGLVYRGLDYPVIGKSSSTTSSGSCIVVDWDLTIVI